MHGRIEVKWGNSCIELEHSIDILRLNSVNYRVELRPRTIIVKGSIDSSEVVETGKHRKKKYLYINFKEKIKGFVGRRYSQETEFILRNFEVKILDLEFERYITIITPGPFLYNYVIISQDQLVIELSGKREVYIDRELKMITVYIV